MAICALSHTLADGTVVIALDAQNLNLTTCEMVVITGAEFDSELMNFTPSDALQVSGAVALLWALAWCFRVVRKSLSISEVSNETE
jgi:hypothetical protein